MMGLKIHLECPYFAAFRKPTSTSLILTYIIPPYTTIRGLFSNALGISRDNLEIQEWFKIGIKLINTEKSRELTKILKLKGDGRKYQKNFPSSPVFREFLIEPKYDIYVVGNQDKIEMLYNALLNPKRSLYLGSSDDLVDISVSQPIKVEDTEIKETWSVVEGVYEGCIVERIPYKFLKNRRLFDVEFKIVSIPIKRPIRGALTGYNFEGSDNIWVT